MKTHWKKVFNKEYLGSHDLDDGKDLVAVIERVEVRDVKDSSGKDGKCNVAIFQGKIKPMILNVTNCKVIKKLSGSNFIEDWKELPVTVYVDDKVKAFGEITEGLRIREKSPNIEKPELTPEHEMWGRAVEHLSKPNATIKDIQKRYRISKENISKLQEAAL